MTILLEWLFPCLRPIDLLPNSRNLAMKELLYKANDARVHRQISALTDNDASTRRVIAQ